MSRNSLFDIYLNYETNKNAASPASVMLKVVFSFPVLKKRLHTSVALCQSIVWPHLGQMLACRFEACINIVNLTCTCFSVTSKDVISWKKVFIATE